MPRTPQERAPRPAPADSEILDHIRKPDPEGAAYDHPGLRPLGVPVTVWGGDRDPGCDVEDLSWWSEVTTEGLVVRVFGGGHFYLNPRKEELAGFVASRLS